jgi:hypothetical protein
LIIRAICSLEMEETFTLFTGLGGFLIEFMKSFTKALTSFFESITNDFFKLEVAIKPP